MLCFKWMSKAAVSDVMLIPNHFQHCYQFDLPPHHLHPFKIISKNCAKIPLFWMVILKKCQYLY